MEANDRLIVGLGNPGEQYRSTRHNVGFMIVDRLAGCWGAGAYQDKWQALHAVASLRGKKLHIVKPLTFMNRSGRAVAQYFRFFKMSPEQLLVVHDDLDMSPGRIKLVKGGGAGGHNGIKSIVESLGTADFHRLKFGIGRPGKGGVHADFPVENYVLSNFDENDVEIVEARFASVRQGVELFLQGETAKALGLLNSLK
jgi:PTH1 family peptidyl-tRNA hydrolase